VSKYSQYRGSLMVVLRARYSSDAVVLILGLAFLGCSAAMALCEQYRLATLSLKKEKRIPVLLLVAVALGWTCTWSVHAVALASIQLSHGDEHIPVRFNAAILLLAGAQSVFQTFVGLYITAKDGCFNNTRAEIMEKFIARTSATTPLDEIKRMSKFRILFIVLTHSLEYINIGGAFGGAGIAVCHFLVLKSIQFQGTIEYNPGIVVAATLFSAFNGTGAFWAFFRLLSLFPSLNAARVVIALMGVVTVCGMHFVGMQAVTFHYDPDVHLQEPTGSLTVAPGRLYSGAVAASVINFVLMVQFSLRDQSAWLLRTSEQLRLADKAISTLVTRAARNSRGDQGPPEIARYARMYLATSDAPRSRTASGILFSRAASYVRTVPRRALYNNYFDEEDSSLADSHGDSRSQDGLPSRGRSISLDGALLQPSSATAGALDDRPRTGHTNGENARPPSLEDIVEAGLQAHSQRILLGPPGAYLSSGLPSPAASSGKGSGRTVRHSSKMFSLARIVPTASSTTVGYTQEHEAEDEENA
jgi:NO-binding membrane sensor protein with MHYT domain